MKWSFDILVPSSGYNKGHIKPKDATNYKLKACLILTRSLPDQRHGIRTVQAVFVLQLMLVEFFVCYCHLFATIHNFGLGECYAILSYSTAIIGGKSACHFLTMGVITS